jgi:hypothetical protein
VVGLAIGKLILDRAPQAQNEFAALLLGVLIVIVVTALPFVGGLATFVVVLFGLGAPAIALWPQGPRDAAPA